MTRGDNEPFQCPKCLNRHWNKKEVSDRDICVCGHARHCHHDGTGIWAKGCNQPLAMECECPCERVY